ncbi:MAG: hypothetical protein L0214_07630 [candidate division NC10 bacterium]|nr:hypothetical protein [candidate division NC10 bacterium]
MRKRRLTKGCKPSKIMWVEGETTFVVKKPRMGAVLSGYRIAEARDVGELPLLVELCGRIIENGMPCYGVLYRPQPGQVYCYKCGATATNEDERKRPRPVEYVRVDKMSVLAPLGTRPARSRVTL